MAIIWLISAIIILCIATYMIVYGGGRLNRWFFVLLPLPVFVYMFASDFSTQTGVFPLLKFIMVSKNILSILSIHCS